MPARVTFPNAGPSNVRLAHPCQNRAVRYQDGASTFKTMLREAGVRLERPDAFATWQVFKEFAAQAVEGVDPEDGDMSLFQWGAYDWGDGKGERFEVDFTRQFSILTPSGDYDHMEQLRCTFFYEPTDTLRAFGTGEEWIEDGFGEVESLPVFAVIRDRPSEPRDHRIQQDEI
jgi:hypothetical protein